MGTGSPLAAVIVMRSWPAVSLPSGLPGMTTPLQRRTARKICMAYSARLNERLGASSNALAGRLRRGLEAGQLRPDASVEIINDALLGACIGRVLARASFDPDDARALTRLVLEGVAG